MEIYGTDGIEVESVRASGRTRALVTLKAADVRSVADGDMLAMHPAFRSILAESRQRCKPGEGISTAEMRRRLKQRRLVEASSGRRRAPRPAQRSRPSRRR